jgi:DNA-directed RNA polymerase subunit RPC12/RpoP
MRAFAFKSGKLQIVKENKEAIIRFINQTGLTKEQILEEIGKSGYSSCYFCINPETLQYWIEPVTGVSLNRKCVNCGSDNWLILKPDSATSAIQCLSCKHVELHTNQQPKRKVWWH